MIDIKIWTIIFLMVAFQGFFLAFLIFLKKNENYLSKLFLGSFITVFSVILIFWVGFWNEFPFRYAHFNFLYNPLPLLIGPLLFLYIKTFYRKTLNRRELLHFAPFIALILYFLPFYILSTGEKFFYLQEGRIDEILFSSEIIDLTIEYISKISFVAYSIVSFLFVRKEHQKSKPYVIKITLFLFALFSLLMILTSITSKFITLPLSVDASSALIISFLIYLIGYLGVNKNEILALSGKNIRGKYTGSGLKPENAQFLINQLKSTIEKNKSYLLEEYRLSDLSKESGISSHHISELLNKYHNENFSDFINRYRVKEAKKLLRSDKYAHRTISSIGFDVGFNSRTAFYSAFKKFTNLTPSEFQKKRPGITS